MQSCVDGVERMSVPCSAARGKTTDQRMNKELNTNITYSVLWCLVV
jgi:hypothetical protein